MISRLLLLRFTLYTLCAGVLIWLTEVAQASPAPAPVLRNVPAPWIGYGLIVVLVGIVLSISLLPSKRSHQD